LEYTRDNLGFNVGLRFENSLSELKNEYRKPLHLIFPYCHLNYKISQEQNLRFAFSRSVERPKIYQLDPAKSFDDPYAFRGGNPFLIPEIRTCISAEYAKRFKSDYFSSRLFYNRSESVITNVAFLNDTSAFESSIYNLGTIQQYGVQLSGTFRLSKIISVIPYLRLYEQNCKGNTKAREFPIEDSNQMVFESNLTTLFSFKQDINLMVSHQYSGRRNNIQGSSFADALCVIKLEKTFNKKLKIGISNALPFKKDFTYQGSEVKSANFYSRYTGVIHAPDFACWFNVGYRFSAGKQHGKTERNREDIELVPQKGI
jgi:outer membrane receptor protein involved in Fe transport